MISMISMIFMIVMVFVHFVVFMVLARMRILDHQCAAQVVAKGIAAPAPDGFSSIVGVEVVGVQVDEPGVFAVAFAAQLRQRAVVQPAVSLERPAAAGGFGQQLAIQVVMVDDDLWFFARQFLARALALGVVAVNGHEAIALVDLTQPTLRVVFKAPALIVAECVAGGVEAQSLGIDADQAVTAAFVGIALAE